MHKSSQSSKAQHNKQHKSHNKHFTPKRHVSTSISPKKIKNIQNSKHKKSPLISTSSRHASGMGFSWPVSRELDGIMNVEAIAESDASFIEQIWTDFHSTNTTSMVTTLNKSQFDTLKQRGTATPLFIHPIFRDTGYFVMLSQFQDNAFLITYLEDYRKNPENAAPYMTITFYDELKHSKDLVLVRADICALATLTKSDADFMMRTLIDTYIDDQRYNDIFNFNMNQSKFNFDEYLANLATTTVTAANTDETAQV